MPRSPYVRRLLRALVAGAIAVAAVGCKGATDDNVIGVGKMGCTGTPEFEFAGDFTGTTLTLDVTMNTQGLMLTWKTASVADLVGAKAIEVGPFTGDPMALQSPFGVPQVTIALALATDGDAGVSLPYSGSFTLHGTTTGDGTGICTFDAAVVFTVGGDGTVSAGSR